MVKLCTEAASSFENKTEERLETVEAGRFQELASAGVVIS
jgi:hypothetical protein